MTARELFGVVVRTVGLLLAVYGFCQLVLIGIGVAARLGVPPTAAIIAYALSGVLGLALMRFPGPLVRFAYGKG